VEWVTPVTELNRQKGAFLHYGNESSLGWAYGDVCLVVWIGETGDRSAYKTVAELKAQQKRRNEEIEEEPEEIEEEPEEIEEEPEEIEEESEEIEEELEQAATGTEILYGAVNQV
jgi:hypothetical protein